MSIRSLNMQKYHAPKNEVMVGVIVRKLYGQGYPCCDARDVVMLIEKYHMDISQFEFPDGDYEKFKRDVLDGKYDRKIQFMTDDDWKHRQELIRTGKMDVTY